VERICRRDEGFGRHAPDTGAGRTVGASIDEHEIVDPIANLAQRSESGRAGTHDRHVHLIDVADLQSLSGCVGRLCRSLFRQLCHSYRLDGSTTGSGALAVDGSIKGSGRSL
jgi:hypothetical protein